MANVLLAGEFFVRPDDFIPERWYSEPELILDRSGFAPFSLGESPQALRTTPSRKPSGSSAVRDGGFLVFARSRGIIPRHILFHKQPVPVLLACLTPQTSTTDLDLH